MLTHDYTVCCSVVHNIYRMTSLLSISNLLFNILFTCFNFWSIQVNINILTLTLYYRFLITNSHFKTFFDCISSNHCIRYLKSFKNFVTDILVVSQLDMLSAVKKTKKTINFFEAKINNKLFCSYLIFFAFQVKSTRNF